jgi:lipid-binding SYLF domain-containing protein
MLLVLGGSLWAKDNDKAKAEVERLKTAAEVLSEIMGTPEEGIPSELLARAECVVVVPGLKKGAIGIGGRFGRGAVSCRRGADRAGAWGSPSMLTVAGGSFGLQLGGSSTDVVMLVMNKKGVDHLLKSKFTLGGDASAAAGPKGRSAAAATDATMRAEILTYSRSRGLFAGVSLDGASVRPDKDANERLYGQRVEAKALLIDGKLGIPDAARPFTAALTKYAPKNVSAK